MRAWAAAALALACAGAAHAQQATYDTAAGLLGPDSAFRRAGPVLRWNVVTRELIERDLAARSRARPAFYDGNNNSRLYALVSAAQYDALRATADSGEAAAAAGSAAAAVLAAVFPRERVRLLRELDAERARLRARGIPAGALRAGERSGALAARRWTADAAAERKAAAWSGTVPAGPDRWRGDGTPPGLAIALGLRPWFLASRDEFRPPPPPAPGTPAFAEGLAAVRTASEQRTRVQTRATWAWARNAATLWSEIAGDLILRRRLSERDAARALMYLNMTLSDATIACWDAKLSYWLIRPSEADSTIEPSIPVPNFPSYPSAHATLFAAGAAVLGHLVPEEQATLDSLAREATLSRVWAGVHYPFDNDAGARLGRQVAGAAIRVLDAEGASDAAGREAR